MISNSIRLRKPRCDCWGVWLAGALAQISYNFLSMQLFHYYVYFYVVGVALLVDSLLGWGELNANGINIRLGFSFTSNLYFEWRDIVDLKIVNIKKTSIVTSGGLSKIPFASRFYVQALTLTFNDDLYKELEAKIEAVKKRCIFKEKVALDNQKNKLIVFEIPEGGFVKVINAIGNFEDIGVNVDVEREKEDSTDRLTNNRNFVFLIDLFVVIFVLGTIIYYL